MNMQLTADNQNALGDGLMAKHNEIFAYGLILGTVAFPIALLAPQVGIVMGLVVAGVGIYSWRFSREGGMVVVLWSLVIILLSMNILWYFMSPRNTGGGTFF